MLVDRGDHRPDKGGIKSKAPGLDIGMEPGDSQLSRQSKAAVKAEKFLELNREYASKWPVITKVKPALPDADALKDQKNKLEELFSPNPGTGD